MDFQFSDEQKQLRVDVQQFLRDSIPAEYVPSHVGSQEQWEIHVDFAHKLAANKWVAPAWPEEYGGLGWKHIQQMIFAEEMAYAGAPEGARVFNVGMIGPTLIVHGSDEQMAEHLPRITSGESVWCQGYSEPGAGSDLAALQTRATRDGDDYLVTGQKIWTTGAHHADWCFLLVRTNLEAPKHRGISFLLVDMKSPGITVNAIPNMGGLHEFNEVFFEDVRVPVANRIGEEDGGWYVAMTLLDFERSNVASIAANQRLLEQLAGHFGNEGSQTNRHLLADFNVSNEVGRMLSYNIGWIQESGGVPNHEASVIKVYATELAQAISNFGVNALGLAGQLLPSSPGAVLEGVFALEHQMAVSPTIYSGSSEIQRNIIATRGLGLPRE